MGRASFTSLPKTDVSVIKVVVIGASTRVDHLLADEVIHSTSFTEDLLICRVEVRRITLRLTADAATNT